MEKGQMKVAFLITNIEEFGKFIAYCIEHDVSIFRTFWDGREAGQRCYVIDWVEKRCYYSSRQYWEREGFRIAKPVFEMNPYGKYVLLRKEWM